MHALLPGFLLLALSGTNTSSTSAPAIHAGLCGAAAAHDAASSHLRTTGTNLGLVGYLCPSCPQTPDPELLFATVHPAYTVVVISFLMWTADGHIVENIDGGATKQQQNFTFAKRHVQGLQAKHKKVFVTIGGSTAGSLNCHPGSSFAHTFTQGVLDVVAKYGLDGVDFDIEHRTGSDFAKCATLVGGIMQGLKKAKPALLISVVPQEPNLDPQQKTITVGHNEEAPLVAGYLGCMDHVGVQMYNSYAGAEGTAFAEKYAGDLVKNGFSTKDSVSGKSYSVKVGASKLVLGFPATTAAANTGYVQPAQLVTMVEALRSTGIDVQALFTWSIGFDQRQNWAFAKAVATTPSTPTPAPPAPTPKPPAPTPPTPKPAPAGKKYKCNWNTGGAPACVVDPTGWGSLTQCQGVCHKA